MNDRSREYVTRSYCLLIPRSRTELAKPTDWSLVDLPSVLVFVLVCWLTPSTGFLWGVVFWVTLAWMMRCCWRRVRGRDQSASEFEREARPSGSAAWSDGDDGWREMDA